MFLEDPHPETVIPRTQIIKKNSIFEMLMQVAAELRNKATFRRVQSDMAAAQIVIQVNNGTALLNGRV